MRLKSLGIVLLLGLINVTASVAETKVYRCPGEDGVPEFSDQPCENAEIITIEDTGNAGLSVWVPDLPPLPEKPKPQVITPTPVQVVVSQPQPYGEPLYYPSPNLHSIFRPRRHHHDRDDFHPPLRPPRTEPPTPPRPETPPPQPRRTTVEIPDKYQRQN